MVCRYAFERLLRKVLNLPNKPAVVILNWYGYRLSDGEYWSTAEDGFGEPLLKWFQHDNGAFMTCFLGLWLSLGCSSMC
jgi:hypothetical protein